MPRRSSERTSPVRSSAARRSTSGSIGPTSETSTRASTAFSRKRASSSSSSCSRSRASRSSRSSASVSNSLAARARSSSSSGQSLLLDLLDRHLDIGGLLLVDLELNGLRLAGLHAGERGLDRLDQPPVADLGDVVALRPGLVTQEIEDDRVALACTGRSVTGTSSATLVRSASSSAGDELLGNLRLRAGHLERRPVAELRLREHGTVAVNWNVSLSPGRPSYSTSGVEIGRMPESVAAFQNQLSMWLRTASSQTAARPTRAMTTWGGRGPSESPGREWSLRGRDAACS